MADLSYVVAITGASGSIYGKRLIEQLILRDINIHIIISDPGKQVIEHELGFSFKKQEDANTIRSKELIKNEADRENQKKNDLEGFIQWITSSIDKSHLEKSEIQIYSDDDFFAPVCSGSFRVNGMIIIPCSMATLSAIANGTASSLIERTADVMLKESRALILVPRETPLNRIHLKNMLDAKDAGALIVPAMPAFYHKPKSMDDIVDFVVGKVLDQLGIEHNLYKRWGS